jgi:4-diphosphocytidyl-2C-methyl-D-erythritol kinase
MTDPARTVTPVVRLAPAKLNLTLAVVGRRPDGYHALHTVMAPLDLTDRVTLAVDPSPGAADSLHVEGFDAGPTADNHVLRALDATRRAVRSSLGEAPPAVAVRLDKRIPVAAGLAGGSSDAAATIDGALEAWAAGDALSLAARSAVAASIGSDVPFFLAGGPALVEGRGERVTALHGLRLGAGERAPGVVLVTPAVPAHTAAVFAAWADGAMGQPGVAARSSEHFASEYGSGLTAAQLLERAGVLAAGQRPAAGRRDGRGRARGVPPGADAPPRPTDRAVRLGTDPLVPLSFAGRRGACRRFRPGGGRDGLRGRTGGGTALRRRHDLPRAAPERRRRPRPRRARP